MTKYEALLLINHIGALVDKLKRHNLLTESFQSELRKLSQEVDKILKEDN